mgnify:CR=1 FL=1
MQDSTGPSCKRAGGCCGKRKEKRTGLPVLSLFVVRLAGEASAPLRGLAGGAALYVQLQVFLFPLEQAVRQQLLLDVLKADALHGVGKALAG